MTRNMNEKGIMDLDLLLAPDEKTAEETIDKANAAAMRKFEQEMGVADRPKPVPLPHRRRQKPVE